MKKNTTVEKKQTDTTALTAPADGAKPLKMKLTGGEGSKLNLEFCTPPTAAQLAATFGTISVEAIQYYLNQLIAVFPDVLTQTETDRQAATQAANIAMGVLHGLKPQNELEGMLAVQMIGVHNAAMTCLRRVMLDGQTSTGREININLATKLLRTYAAQLEALKSYRTGGQQRMTVEHVHVNDGGQAIIGNVNKGGNDEKRR